MSNDRIGILKGDDIGLEVVPVAAKVIKAAVKGQSGQGYPPGGGKGVR